MRYTPAGGETTGGERMPGFSNSTAFSTSCSNILVLTVQETVEREMRSLSMSFGVINGRSGVVEIFLIRESVGYTERLTIFSRFSFVDKP